MMRKNFVILHCIFLCIFSFAQKPPKPPKPPKNRVEKQENPNDYRLNGEAEKKVFPKFEIPLSLSNDTKSEYYHKNIEERLAKFDSAITAEQIISLTKFYIADKDTNPKYLDSLCNKAYKQNEEGQFDEAIINAEKILKMSPTNITGYKEACFAYERKGDKKMSENYLKTLSKIIDAVFKYGDGTYDYPFIVTNFFEGISIYEAKYRCRPKKFQLFLDKKGRLLGAYNCYSSALDEIFIRYTELSHWKPRLSKDDYNEEK